VVLADEVEGCFEPASESFSILTLRNLAIPDLEHFCFHYNRQQVVVAAKAYLLSYLLDHGFGSAIFLDADILVLGNLDPLFKIVEKHAILLTPHLLAPLEGEQRAARELNILLSGTYNGGFLGVSDTSSTRAFLYWWQDRLYEHCCHAVAHGMHYDQHWLDFVPVYFDGVHILRDPTYNVAYWSLPERNAYLPAPPLPGDAGPCRFFHFSGFDPEQPPAVTRYSPRLTMANVGPAMSLFDHYANLLDAAGYQAAIKWPYAYNCFDNAVPIPDAARQLYRDLGAAVASFGDPRRVAGSGSYFSWLNERLDGASESSLPLTRLWQGVYEQRPDVQMAIPDALGANRANFVQWATNFGIKEMGIHESLVPSEWKS
jgi:hypothetical protein